jgi:hypothetical protein
MATVADLSGNRPNNAPLVDVTYSKANRTNAGTPIGSLVPLYPGEIVLDSTNRLLWRAIGITNANWEPTNDSI